MYVLDPLNIFFEDKRFHICPFAKTQIRTKIFLNTRSDDQNLDGCFSQDDVSAWKSIQIFFDAVGENTAGLILDAGENTYVSRYLKENISKIRNPNNMDSFSLDGQIQVCNSMQKKHYINILHSWRIIDQ